MKKLLIISDAPTGTTGFGRITKDLAIRIHKHLGDKIEVCTAGYGPPPSRRLTFHHYSTSDPVPNGWQIPELPEIYNDFCENDEDLILFYIWDLSRLLHVADPTFCTIPRLQTFLKDAPIKKYVYVPIDAEGVDGKLSHVLAYTASKFDKVLAYTQFGVDVLERTFPDKKFEYIPHGIDTSIFYPRNKIISKQRMATEVFKESLKGKFILSCVATNQKRKDFSLVFGVAKELLNRGKDVKLWLQTDVLTRYWDVQTLVKDFGLSNRVSVTMGLTNEDLATYYSASDAIIAPGRGEGFSLTNFEGMACGIPCYHTNYAGAPEFYLNKEYLIEPKEFQYEDSYLSKRPILNVKDFCDSIEKYNHIKPEFNKNLDWNILWSKWQGWIER